MVSPSATSPALTTLKDNGYFFRTAPSDVRQGQVLAKIVKTRGIKEIAVTYTNNDYGKGLVNSFSNALKAAGGKVVLAVAHEDGKADYAAEVGALAASGAKHLAGETKRVHLYSAGRLSKKGGAASDSRRGMCSRYLPSSLRTNGPPASSCTK